MNVVRFKFEDLHVYQEAISLSSDVFTVTKSWVGMFKYSLADQFQRAALSIALNIAEGSSRTTRDFRHFLTIARGSCYECIPIVMIARKQQLLTDQQYIELYDRINHLARMITSLKRNVASP